MSKTVTTDDPDLAEYLTLKNEQASRIGFRDNLVYTTLAAIAAVLFAYSQSRQPGILLLITPATAVLGWKYHANDKVISEIRRYIGGTLANKFPAPDGIPVFGWETPGSADTQWRVRKTLQLCVDLGLFVIFGAGVSATVMMLDPKWWQTLAFVINWGMAIVLALQFVNNSGLRSKKTKTVEGPRQAEREVSA